MFSYCSEYWGYFTSDTVDLTEAFTAGGGTPQTYHLSWEAHMERNNWTRQDVERFIVTAERFTARDQRKFVA